MSDLDAATPRVFLARHGETEWTISGQHTGSTEIPLTALGERQVASTASLLVGTGKLLDPAKVRKVWVSPRSRAFRTFQLLFAGQEAELGESDDGERCGGTGEDEVAPISEPIFGGGKGSVIVTEDIREWDYGEYEGMKAEEVRELRNKKGLDMDGRKWNVWRDGCEGGESKQDVEQRLDRLIEEVKEVQRPYMNEPGAGDVVLVAHGLILRCFFKRWLSLPVDHPLPVMMPPGTLAILSYNNHDVNRPAFHLGVAVPPNR